MAYQWYSSGIPVCICLPLKSSGIPLVLCGIPLEYQWKFFYHWNPVVYHWYSTDIFTGVTLYHGKCHFLTISDPEKRIVTVANVSDAVSGDRRSISAGQECNNFFFKLDHFHFELIEESKSMLGIKSWVFLKVKI